MANVEPRITGFSPSVARPGETVRIRGSQLTGATRVLIGGLNSQITFQSDTEIWVEAPRALFQAANPISVEINGRRIQAPTALRFNAPPPPPNPPSPPPPSLGSGLPFSTQSAFSAASTVFGAASGGIGATAAQGGAAAQAASGVLAGVSSVSGQAYSLGANIGQSLLSGVLSPFGRSGAALGGVGSAAIGVGGSLFSGAVGAGAGILGAGARVGAGAALLPLNLAGGLASAGGSLLGSAGGALGGLAGGLGGAFSLGGAALGGIGSIISQATGAITGIFQTILQGATNLISTIGDGLGSLGQLAGSVFSAALDIASDVLNEAKNIGRTVRSLAFNTGTSEAQAAKTVNAFNFAGVNPQAVGQAFSSPGAALSMGMRARMLGLPDPSTDPEGFLMGGARAQQSAAKGGIMGAMMFNGMMGPQMMGAFGSAFSLGPDRLQRNLQLAKSFELPSNVGQLGGDAEAAGAAIGALVTNIKLVVAETLIPLMPQLNRAFSWLIEHKTEVVSAITRAGEWLFIEMPRMVLHAGAATLRALGTVLGGVSEFLTTTWQDISQNILTNLPSILQGFDTFINGMRQMAFTTISIGSAIAQAALNFSQTPVGRAVLGTAGAAAATTTGATPAARANNAATSGAVPSHGVNPTTGQPYTTSNPASSPSNPWNYSIVPGQGVNPTTGQPYSATTSNPNGGFSWGRLGTAAAAGAAGAYGGAQIGARAGAGILGAIGAVVAGTAGAAAGGIGLIPGAAAGWAAGAAAGATPGAILGGILGAGAAAWQAWQRYPAAQNAANGARRTWQQTMNPTGGQAGATAAPATSTGAPAPTANGGTPGMNGNPGTANVGSLLPQQGQSVGGAYQQAQLWLQGHIPASNLAGQQQAIASAIKSAQSGANTVGGWAAGAQEWANSRAGDLDNLGDSWGRGMLDGINGIQKNTDKSAQAQLDLLRGMNGMMERLLARTSAYIAEDTAANLLRV